MRFPLMFGLVLAAIGNACASPLPDYPFVFAAGSAETSVAPNIAHLRFTISARDRDSQKALDAVRRASATVLRILAKAGVQGDDIDASAIDKSEERHWDEDLNHSVPDGFEASRDFAVTIRNLVNYPEMGNALLMIPEASRFRPTFNRTDRASLEAELFSRAAENAKRKADQMARAFGRGLGPVRAISQVPFSEVPYWLGMHEGDRPYAMAMDALSISGPDQLLVPATISVTAEVNVVYELN